MSNGHTKRHGLGATDNHSPSTIADLNALISDGTIAVKYKVSRVTVTASLTLTATHSYVTITPASATDVTLFASPVDGQTVDITASNLSHACRVIGSINGVSGNHSIVTAWDNWHLVYNSDLSTWELR